MDLDGLEDVFRSYGADIDILSEYSFVPHRVQRVRDALKLRTDIGTWALKKVHMSPTRLEYIHLVTEHMARANRGTVPRFVRTRYGDAYVVHPSGLYYLTAWFPGREIDMRKQSNLERGAIALAEWHAGATGFYAGPMWQEEAEGKSIRGRLSSGSSALALLQSRTQSGEQETQFERLVGSCAEELVERISRARKWFTDADLAGWEAESIDRGEVCHGNIAKKNLLFDGETATVINYDYVFPGPRLYDFALYLHRYMPAYEWREDVLLRAVSAYESVSGGDMASRERIAAMLMAPLRPLQVVSWYLNRAVSWDEADFVDALEWSMELEERRESAAKALTQNGEFRILAAKPNINESLAFHTIAYPGRQRESYDLTSAKKVRAEVSSPDVSHLSPPKRKSAQKAKEKKRSSARPKTFGQVMQPQSPDDVL